MPDGKEAALKWLAEQSASICMHPDVYPCTWIAEGIGQSVRKVRSWMRELEAEGFVKKCHEGGIDDWTGEIYCIHGYALTRKGKATPYYQEAYKREVDWINRALQEPER